jgi:hypothetical protein
MSLPGFFIALAGATLVMALATLWSSLRAAFGGVVPVTSRAAVNELPDQAALRDEKNSLLRAIRDLEYEHEVGKISDADFERLNRAYRARAKQVLELLDRDVTPYLDRARALLEGSVASVPAKKASKKNRKLAEPTPEPEVARVECAKCGTENDPDAAFCKRCAAPMGEAVAPAVEAKAESRDEAPDAAAPAEQLEAESEHDDAKVEVEAKDAPAAKRDGEREESER